MMKKGLFLLFFMLMPFSVAQADIFDPQLETDADYYNALYSDSSGYSYRSGIDYDLPYRKKDPKISSNTYMSLGCSGFDFGSNFKNQFSSQAATDYLKNVSSEAMAAAPMLLLEYVSPTMADVVKHFNSLANLKLGMRYAQCEDIEKSVSGEFEKLRKKSEYECIKSKNYDDIDRAIEECKKQTDPFAFLQNYEGVSLADGAEINVMDDLFKILDIDEEEKEELKKIAPETTISKNGIDTQEAEVSIKEELDKTRDVYYAKIDDLVQKYIDTGDISETEIQSVSVPGSFFNKPQIRNVAMLTPEKRYISIAKIASEISYWKTLEKYERLGQLILERISRPNTNEVERDVLKNTFQEIQNEIALVKNQRERISEYNKVMSHVLDEANRQRLETLVLQDGTRVFSIKAEEEEEKSLMMMPEDE